LTRINAEMVYEAFRRFLVKQLRIVDDETIHVGEVCSCLRKSFYTRRYGDLSLRHLEKTKYVILGLGLSTHYVLEETLHEMGFHTETPIVEYIVTKDYKIRVMGTPDAFNDKHVVEIKTTKKIPKEPFRHHLMQLNTYMWMLKVRIGYIVYIDKSTGYVKVFEHYFDNNIHVNFIDRAVKFYEALKYNIPPSIEKSGLCNYCEWRWRCYNDNSSKLREKRETLNTSEFNIEYGEKTCHSKPKPKYKKYKSHSHVT